MSGYLWRRGLCNHIDIVIVLTLYFSKFSLVSDCSVVLREGCDSDYLSHVVRCYKVSVNAP